MVKIAFPIVIRLAGQPEGKGRARSRIVTKPGAASFVQTYSAPKTRKYEDQLRYSAAQAMGDATPIEGPVVMTVTAALPIPPSWSKKKQACAREGSVWPTSKPDADNFAKSALDGLNKIVFRDDSQVVALTAVKIYSEKPGLLIVVRRPETWGPA